MNNSRTLTIVALVLTAPAALLLLFGVPEMIRAFVALAADNTLTASTMSRDAVVGCFKILGGLIALVELWRLAIKTIRGKRYKFGLTFWGALVFGLIATNYSYALFGPEAALFFSLPLLALAYYMWRLQKKLHSVARNGIGT
jgi:hypothetical protein